MNVSMSAVGGDIPNDRQTGSQCSWEMTVEYRTKRKVFLHMIEAIIPVVSEA